MAQQGGDSSIPPNVVEVDGLTHRYGERLALTNLSFSVRKGEIFGLLGPNGGGKTTTFRILSTLIRPTSGTARITGFDLITQAHDVRRSIGVVFQAPSLDKKLTAYENLMHQGHLYGMSGKALKDRILHLLNRVKLADRANEYVERFSGGMRRRVELAKGLLHNPQILILDEPSTGLDPGARHDLWHYLGQLSREDGVTSLLTTHYMEEAAHCHRLAILNKGELVALDTPDNLRAIIGGDVITIQASEPEKLQAEIREKLNVDARLMNGVLRIEQAAGHELVSRLGSALAGRMESMTLSKPTLEDVFIRKTGHTFWAETADDTAQNGAKREKVRP
ncbi:MAG TPA: ATP-binding cassette domain-containing protein [Planctomycetota bacterium]|nr:ATP-binding cassette domain-containing protein [Planctomycetota bacterium]